MNENEVKDTEPVESQSVQGASAISDKMVEGFSMVFDFFLGRMRHLELITVILSSSLLLVGLIVLSLILFSWNA